MENKTKSKSQQGFSSEAHNTFTEKINRIVPHSNNDKRIKMSDEVTIYPQGYEFQRESGIDENKKLNIMINFNEVKEEKTKQHNPDWLKIPVHPYRILTAGGS